MSVIRRLILGLWTGLLVAQIGFFVPVLFQTLTEPGQAARVAGQGFVGISYVSLVAGVVVFLLRTKAVTGRGFEARWAIGPGLMMVLAHVGLHPLMEATKHAGVQGAPGPAFLALHAASGLIYVLATVAVAALWVRDERRA